MLINYAHAFSVAFNCPLEGVQWLCGRVLVWGLRGCGFEPHPRHCVVSLRKAHLFLLSVRSTQEDPSRYNFKIVDWNKKNQIKRTKGHTSTFHCIHVLLLDFILARICIHIAYNLIHVYIYYQYQRENAFWHTRLIWLPSTSLQPNHGLCYQ